MTGAKDRMRWVVMFILGMGLLWGAPTAHGQATSGSLCVTLTPPAAVSAGAKWRRVGTTSWRSSGTTEQQVPVGSCDIEFATLAAWISPTTQTAAIDAGQTTNLTAQYTQKTGALCVTLSPPEAVAAGAQWRRNGTTQWFDSGTTETGVPVGTYSMNYKFPQGWMTFGGPQASIGWNQTTQMTQTYTATTGALSVTCSPAQVAAAGAQWRRAGTTAWFNSGAVESNVPTWTWPIEFTPVPDWDPPTSFTAQVLYNQTASRTATYTHQQGTLRVTINPPEAAAAGAAWRRVGTTVWRASGSSETGILTGACAIEGSLCGKGWAPPASPTVTISNNQVAEYTFNYVPSRADLAWSTYLGGSGDDSVNAIAMDDAGNIYVTGSTTSAGWASGGFDTTFDGLTIYSDAFVAKLSPSGQFLWSTYLGGNFTDVAAGIAVDRSGNIYVAGVTYSGGWVSGGYNTTKLTDSRWGGAFVVKLSSAGEHLWSSYVSCSGGANDVAVDPSGNLCVVGDTNPDSGWAEGGYDTIANTDYPPYNCYEGFAVKISATGRHLWSTYLGGTRDDHATGVASDDAGNFIVTGSTNKTDWLSGGENTTYLGGAYDAFLVKLSPAGRPVWMTCLGGSGSDGGNDVAVDPSGAICVTGSSDSPGWASGGGRDAFIARYNAWGHQLWHASLGGSGNETGGGVVLDREGNAYVAGVTYSPGWIKGDIDNDLNNGTGNYYCDGFVAKLSLAGRPLWSAYLGGSYDDSCSGIASDRGGVIGVAGKTKSRNWTVGGYDTHLETNSSGFDTIDGFVAKILDHATPSTATSTLCVTLNPPAAVAAGAQWRRVGTAAWHDSGITESGVPAGPCAIEFKPGAFWVAPADWATTLTAGQTLITSGTYTYGAALKVNIAPPEAAAAYAQWRRVGSIMLHNGGETEVAVPATSSTIEFMAAPGWIAPPRCAVALIAGQVTETTVTYIRSASLIVSAVPKVSDVTGYARWRRVGTTLWRMNGTTETEIAPGNYVVEFTWGFNCKPPANIPVMLNAGTVTSITGTYLLPIGGISVKISPPEAAAAGAQWRRVGTTAWFDSGTTETNLAVGKYAVEFKPVADGWVTPTTQSLTVYHGATTTATTAYTGSGSLRVTLSPPEAVAAGAQWRRVGTTAWLDSGTSESAVPAGPCAVEFKPVSGWGTPASHSFSLYPNQGVEVSGVYDHSGSLTVTITPPEAVAAGAKWRRVGTTAWHDSGTSESGILPGTVNVEFLPLSGWNRPATQAAAILQGKTARVQAAYVRQTGSLYVEFAVNLCSSSSPGVPWYWRRAGTQAWFENGAVENDIPTGVYGIELLDPKGIVVSRPEKATIKNNETAVISILLVGPAAVAGSDWTMY